jgi:hypothetical protein
VQLHPFLTSPFLQVSSQYSQGKNHLPIEYEAVWASEPVTNCGETKKFLPLPGHETAQTVPDRPRPSCTDYSIPAPKSICFLSKLCVSVVAILILFSDCLGSEYRTKDLQSEWMCLSLQALFRVLL